MVKRWLIFHYVCSENDLDYLAMHDLIKMVHETNLKNCVFYILFEAGHYGRYTISITDKLEVTTVQKLDMSDTRVIRDFILKGKEEYKSEKYVFIYGGHATNFYLNPDLDKYVFIGDLVKVFTDTGLHLEILILDTCLMASIETLSEVYKCCNYLLACEHFGLNNGFITDNIGYIFNHYSDTQIIGSKILNDSYVFIKDKELEGQKIEWTGVLIECKYVPNLLNELSKIKIDTKNLPKLNSLKDIKIEYNQGYTDKNYPYLDLYSFVNILSNDNFPEQNKTVVLDLIKKSVRDIKRINVSDKFHGINFCPNNFQYTFEIPHILINHSR
jgi:hypothetical protein